jgi:hypothetical protein
MGLGFDPAFQRELARQSWPLYGVGMGFIALRMYAAFLLSIGMEWVGMEDPRLTYVPPDSLGGTESASVTSTWMTI